MKKSELIKLAQNYGMTEKLAKAAINQFGDYDYFKECANNICNYGINGGFAGYIYYYDTVKFTQKNKKDIIEFCKSFAESLSESMPAMLSMFNCFKDYSIDEIMDGLYNPRSQDRQIIFNGLAWFIGEEIARIYCDNIDAE